MVSGVPPLPLIRSTRSFPATGSPSISRMTSPTAMPARSAGSPGVTLTIWARISGPTPRSPIANWVRASGTIWRVRSRLSASRTTMGISRSARGSTATNSASQVSTTRPATLTIRSPTAMPARSAGESSTTRPTTGGCCS